MVAPEPVRLVKVSHQFELDGRPLSVLDSVDLAVGQGEFVALWEPSGCGKTTLLRLIAGLERPRSRRIFAGEREIASPDPSPILVFQVSTLYPRRAVRQNAALGLEVRGLSRSQSHRIDHALRQVGLEGSAPVFWRYGAAHGTRSRSGR